jgi:hypothetical protein
MRKTNPISRLRPPVAAGGDNIADCGLGTDLWQGDESCKTNPISGDPRCPTFQYSIIPPFQSDAYRAKQTQFGTWCPEMDAGRLAGYLRRASNRAKRTQFPAVPGGTGPEGRGTKGKCAKRTQFARRARVALPRPCQANCAKRTRFPVRRETEAMGQSCETKPIRNESSEDAQPSIRSRADSTKRRLCETKPNLGGLGYLGDGRVGGILLCKTKPICNLGAEPMGPVPATVCQPDPRRELRKNPMRHGAASVSIQVEPLSGKPGNYD